MQLRTLFASSLVFLASQAAAQDVDQWKLPPDDEGVSHYTGRLPSESQDIDQSFSTGRLPSEHESQIAHASQKDFMQDRPSEHEQNIAHSSQAQFMEDHPSQHEQQIAHPSQASFLEDHPSEHPQHIAHKSQDQFLKDRPSEHEQQISHKSQSPYLEDSEEEYYYEDAYLTYVDEDEYDEDYYYDEEADSDNFFAAHLDYYTMSDDAFTDKWGYDEDPIFVWESVSDRIEVDLGWVYEEDFSDYDQADYEDFFGAVVDGLDSLDVFINRQFGSAFNRYRDVVEEYQSRLEEADQFMDNFTDEDWHELRSEIFSGITRLNELARDNKLVAAGKLKQSYAKQTMAWETVQAHLDKLGKQTKKKLDKLTIAQTESADQIPVWAACTITGLSVALLFTIVIACGVARTQRRKLKQMELECQAMPVTQRDHTTARQGTLPDPVVAIKKMNEHE